MRSAKARVWSRAALQDAPKTPLGGRSSEHIVEGRGWMSDEELYV